MKEDVADEMKLGVLAEVTGIPPRTIRLYIARGILQGPTTRGRGALYGKQHVERLEKVRQMQSQGLTLGEIGRTLAQGEAQVELPAPERWSSYSVASDIAVLVKGVPSPWRHRRILKALSRLASDLETPEKEEQDEHGN